MAKQSGKTYYSVGPVTNATASGIFMDLKMPGGTTVRIMDERVFEHAARRAGAKLKRRLNRPKQHERSS